METETVRLYHTGSEEIREPDLRRGRRNADCGQGFYLSDSDEFAGKWLRERRDAPIRVNTYELSLSGLCVLRLTRDAAWLDYILRNRAGYADAHPEADVVIGPIANDTIYDTLGILSGGVLSRGQSLALLQIGPSFEQTVIKTEKAAAQLSWRSVRTLSHDAALRFREQARREEADYQAALGRALAEML